MNPARLTLGEYLFHAPITVKDIEVPSELFSEGYDTNVPTVFFGHYWLDDDKPQWQASNACCLDYSVAKEGFLVAYRNYFGQPNTNNDFIVVNAIK